MHRTQNPVLRLLLVAAAVFLLAFAVAACQPVQPPAGAEAAATEAPAEEATEAPAAEATEAPAEESAADTAAAEASAPQGDPARGGYVFAVTTGCGCHFNRDLGAPAGGNKFEGPFGVVYAPNITSDVETGIGSWTEQEIVDSLRLGVKPDGSQLHPIMPYMAYSGLSDQDAHDLAAAIKMIPPVVNAVPENELSAPPAAFSPAVPPPAVAPTEPVARGQYIVSVANCGRCHTPRGENGMPDMTRMLAGAQLQDTIAPNLTPAEGTGVNFLSEQQIADFLQTGIYDDGSKVEGPMEGIINNGTSKLTPEDALAIAAYLKSLPPVASE